jgi:hypothetical protein
MAPRFVAVYPTPSTFLDAIDVEMANGGVLVRGARPEPGSRECEVEVRLGERVLGCIHGRVSLVGRLGVTVEFAQLPQEIAHAAQRLRRGESLDALVQAARKLAVG